LWPFHKYRYKQITTIITQQHQQERRSRTKYFLLLTFTHVEATPIERVPLDYHPHTELETKKYEFLMKLTSCYASFFGCGVRVFICWRAHNYPTIPKQPDRRTAGNRGTHDPHPKVMHKNFELPIYELSLLVLNMRP